MDGELLFLIALVVVLYLRAIYASLVLHRHLGWVVATALLVGLLLDESVSSWVIIACVVFFAVGEFIYQVSGGSGEPPSKLLNPLIRRLPQGPRGRHERQRTEDSGSSDPTED